MKKAILLIAILFVFVSMFAVVLAEGFEGTTFPPAGWTMNDANADGNTWFEYSVQTTAHTGTKSAASASWTSASGAITPDNWLITPQINVPAARVYYMLEFYIGAQDPYYPFENYGVYVSTSGTDPADFIELFSETLSDGLWHYRTQSLAAYAGQTIYLAFRHFGCSDQFYMKLDDVQVREGPQVPVFDISPSFWTFADTQLQNPVTKTFQITNPGIGDITINAGDIYLSDDVEGNFTLTAAGLPVVIGETGEQSYSFSVQFLPLTVGAKTATLNIEDNLTARVLHNITLSGTCVEEPTASIIQLTGTVTGTNNVSLTWRKIYGDPGSPSWVHWDSGLNDTSYGGPASTVDYAVKYDSQEIAGYAGMELTKVKFFLGDFDPAATINVKVWSGLNGTLAPVTVLVNQTVVAPVAGWNEVLLTSAVPITGLEAIYIGYTVVFGPTAFYPGGVDGLATVANRGDLISINGGTWTTLTAYGYAGNWNIHGYMDVPPSPIARRQGRLLHTPVAQREMTKVELKNSPVSALNPNPSRILRGFNIYRDADPTPINPTLITTYAYVDLDLAAGTYEYTVQAVHYSANGPISDPVSVVVTYLPNPATIVSPLNNATGVLPSATLNWGSGGGGQSGYRIYLGTNNPPTDILNGLDLGLVTTYDPSPNLDYNTPYYWQVVPYNGNGSATGCPIWTFTTCVVPSIPFTQIYNEAFDGVTAPALPANWTIINANADDQLWDTSTTGFNSAPNCLYISYNFSMAMNDWAITPALNLATGINYTLNFKYRAGGGGYQERLAVHLGTAATVAGMAVTPLTDLTFSASTYATASVTVTVPTSGTYYLGFYGHSTADQWYMCVDDITLVAPAVPYPATIVNPLNNANGVLPSATLNWASGGYAPTGYKLFFGTDGAGTVTPTNIANNLEMNLLTTYDPTPDMDYSTTYYWMVVPYNTNGNATGCPIWSFTTSDPDIVPSIPEPIVPPSGVLIAGVTIETPGTTGFDINYTTLNLNDLSQIPPNPGLDNTNSYAIVLNHSGGTADITISVLAGKWWIAGYWEGTWHHGTPYPCNGPGTVTLTGIPFGAKGDIPIVVSEGEGMDVTLPVELSSFTAMLTSNSFVSLAWVTETETEVAGYNVYRSADANASNGLKMNQYIIPATNTSQQSSYSYTDSENLLAEHTYYYWLENVDMGGGNSMHGPISATITGQPVPVLPELSALSNAYPNPFRIGASIKIEANIKAGETGTVSIYNIRGQNVKSYVVKPGINKLNWIAKDCGSGIYFYKLSTPSVNSVKKLVIVN